ncbi:nickel pincer cofactor biosynthesis protein LarC [Streptomyces sp. NPDC005790]|uniref:nickel pincer cofactor biosynthesis protein LarC n=1 Tax=Streptomyces sp. NPDC005790 TaxID=3154777 RepID=UPI0033DB1D5D
MSTATSAWFDCSSGASGDMVLGALIDAGAPVGPIRHAVEAVAPGDIRIRTERVTRCGLAATKVHVDTADGPPHRTWHSIRRTLEEAALPGSVREQALSVFARLARAEAAVHGIAVDDVHFHEVGALDAIGDVVGSCAAFHELGIGAASATPIALGSGTTRSAHGRIPVPVPAVLRLLADHGAPARSGGLPYEMCTPTGAALVLTFCRTWNELPPLRLSGGGTGAGTRDPEGVPNVLRVVLGVPADPAPQEAAADSARTTQAAVVECNIDDLDPRIWPHVLDRLMAAGASDAWLTPILMKKGRPAHTLSVLCPPALLPAVREIVMTETSTIGTREYRVEKRELDRHFITVPVGEAAVRVKIATRDGCPVNAQPEYEDVAAAAELLGVPLKTALARAIAAANTDAANRRPAP